MKLLHIDSSIQGTTSASRTISTAVVDSLRAATPTLDIAYRDLAAAPLSHLQLDSFAQAQNMDILAEFQAADIVVIGTGLYNFTIPSQLKARIDRILDAGQTLRYGDKGGEGLAGGRDQGASEPGKKRRCRLERTDTRRSAFFTETFLRFHRIGTGLFLGILCRPADTGGMQ